VSEIGRHKFALIEALKNVKFDLEQITSNQIGFSLSGNALTLKAASVLVQVSSGSGKSILANNLIYFSLKNNKNKNFRIVLCDSHGSYRALKHHSNIDLYELEEANEKQRLKATLESILAKQAATQISIRYETVQEAQNAGEMLDIEICLILIDEFAENFTGREKINSEILELLTKLTTSVRKYGNRLVIMTQAQTASDQLIHANRFNAVIFSKLSEELASAKGIKSATSPILKNSGTFYLESKFDESTFFRTAFISKAELLKHLGEL
jgi:DNA helicase HerA-like ATPase